MYNDFTDSFLDMFVFHEESMHFFFLATGFTLESGIHLYTLPFLLVCCHLMGKKKYQSFNIVNGSLLSLRLVEL